MSITRLLTQTATISDTPTTTSDAEGNWTPGTAVVSTEPCRLEDGQSIEVFDGANRITGDARLFLGPGAVITGRSEVTVAAKRYAVVGQPAEQVSPRGIHHIEALLRRVDHG